MKYVIYKITNKLNNKSYIGQHVYKKEGPRSYMGKGLGIQEAYKTYGRQNFVKEILEIVEDNTSNRQIISERERFWIQTLNTLEPNGYNRHPGGIGGCTSEAGRKAAQTRQQHNYKVSEETKQKISVANKGKPKSDLHKKHLSENHHLRKTWILVHEDGVETEYNGNMHQLVKQLNTSFNKFIRASYKHVFINGVYIKGINKKDYACLRNTTKKEK